MSSRGNPYEIIERMLERMNRQFDETARMWEQDLPALGEGGLGTMGIDLADRGDEFVVTADVPGFEPEDIDLRLVDDRLQIQATRERSTEQQEETYLRSERSHRSLQEQIRLPQRVEEDAIDASLQNGVLTVTLPKAEPSEGGTRIDIL